MGPFLRTLLWILFLLWCVLWLPTIVGILQESGHPDTPEQLTIRLLCAANALLYYVGGGTWLALQARSRGIGRVALLFLLFCFVNTLGPITLLMGKAAAMGSAALPETEHEDAW